MTPLQEEALKNHIRGVITDALVEFTRGKGASVCVREAMREVETFFDLMKMNEAAKLDEPQCHGDHDALRNAEMVRCPGCGKTL